MKEWQECAKLKAEERTLKPTAHLSGGPKVEKEGCVDQNADAGVCVVRDMLKHNLRLNANNSHSVNPVSRIQVSRRASRLFWMVWAEGLL